MEIVLQGVPVQRGIKEDQKSYIASFLYADIVRLIEDKYLYVPNEPELPDFAQRKLNPTRVKAISRYILDTYEEGATFFPPICINIQPKIKYENGKIILPYHSISLRLTDGQHRCFGIHQAWKDLQNERPGIIPEIAELEIGALLYAGLSLESERQAFRDQNLLAQRPGTSLSYIFDQKSPSVRIAKHLMKRVLYFKENNIEYVDNSLGSNNPKLLTFSTLVMSTQHMFPSLKKKQGLEPLIDWATTFWAAAGSFIQDDAWNIKTIQERKKQRQESISTASILFQALGMIANKLQAENISDDELVKWLKGLSSIDWRRDNPLWMEKGVMQIGATGKPIVSNTKTTIRACYQTLSELLGISNNDDLNSNLYEY